MQVKLIPVFSTESIITDDKANILLPMQWPIMQQSGKAMVNVSVRTDLA